jgi:glycosyltransferase involved in cell wall biosynthesis
MNILFVDQSGNLGGAELSLMDVATAYRDRCLVLLFADGPFRDALEQQHIPVKILDAQIPQVRKNSTLIQGLSSLRSLIPLIRQVTMLGHRYDLIYANTQKALVVGSIASLLSRHSLIYHLRDIISSDHFSLTNRRVIVTLANRFASLVIANSQATRAAFIEAGGRPDLTQVIYNGFKIDDYASPCPSSIRQELGLEDKFVVGHFSRLSPWKGQHVLLEALTHCPEDVVALLIGDALFGEQDYVQQLKAQVAAQGLENRVHFLGFRSEIPALMSTCNLIAHTSTAPEPFGRVIVEAMLCERPVVAAAAGGAIELVEHGETGWLCPPRDAQKLTEMILTCRNQPDDAARIAQNAQTQAQQRFNLETTNRQIDQLLQQVRTRR